MLLPLTVRAGERYIAKGRTRRRHRQFEIPSVLLPLTVLLVSVTDCHRNDIASAVGNVTRRAVSADGALVDSEATGRERANRLRR